MWYIKVSKTNSQMPNTCLIKTDKNKMVQCYSVRFLNGGENNMFHKYVFKKIS